MWETRVDGDEWRSSARTRVRRGTRMRREDAEDAGRRRRRRRRRGADVARSMKNGVRGWSRVRMYLCAFMSVLLALVHGYEVPEVEWIHPVEGHVGGGEVITLSGQALAGIQG